MVNTVAPSHHTDVGQSWSEGFLSSWSMILVSEIGDKTFFIACLMAMRHPRIVVYCGAVAALAAMTILSALMGVIFPSILSVRVTQGLSVVLFIGAGAKILYDTLKTKPSGEESSDDEMAEAAAAIGPKDDMESGGGGGSPNSQAQPASNNKIWAWLLSPILVQAFTLTFVAEWGDRSQIATIALAAAKNPYGVTLGGIVGHAICTGGAVLSGNLIASKISHRSVNIVGGLLFIFFGLITFWQLVTHSHHLETEASGAHHDGAADAHH